MDHFSWFKVYDGRGTLAEGETAEARFIKIQAAYELLIDDKKRRQYDNDNRVNPMKVKLFLSLVCPRFMNFQICDPPVFVFSLDVTLFTYQGKKKKRGFSH